MYKTIVIDWRNLCKIMDFSILSGATACTWPTEVEEIQHRLMKRLLCIRMDHPEANIILANDVKPYWRTKYLEEWYAEREELEPVVYKGNRESAVWPFQSSKEEIEAMHDKVYNDASALLQMYQLGDKGMEADDVWGVVTASAKVKVLGISTDHDWGQRCRKGMVEIENPLTGKLVTEELDMRPYYLGGDSGDNIKGCPKYTKAGALAKNGWGLTGAIKHIEANPDSWEDVTDKDHLAKNKHVMQLPCPAWDLSVVNDWFGKLTKIQPIPEDVETVWVSYGLPKQARKKLSESTERKTFINNIRGKLQEKLHGGV